MTKIFAILNITPDSFSDGGKFFEKENALLHLDEILKNGADIIDVGAESTRPGATAISSKEEIDRLIKILPSIAEKIKKFNFDNKKNILLSLDTRHFEVIQKFYEYGVDILNDVSGLKNRETIEFIASKKLRTVFMHSLSVPANPDLIVNSSLHIEKEIINFAHHKLQELKKYKIEKSQLIFDPGIGFNKNAEQSIRILKNIDNFKILGFPILVGHSCKSFLDHIKIDGLIYDKNNSDVSIRDLKTKEISKYLMKKNIDFIRIHF